MSGQVMINQIREFEKSLSIPKKIGIIVTTGDPSENEQMRCLNLGANEFLTKPVRMRQLGESLKKLFMQSNSEVQEEIFDLTVLIIDDDMFSSDIMKRYLINKYHILQASTYEEVFILSYSYP